MRTQISSYRDEHNNVVDDINVEYSPVQRVVVMRDGDDRLIVRARWHDGDVREYEFTKAGQMYQGIEYDGGDGCAKGLHCDVAKALFPVGLTVKPHRLEREAATENHDEEAIVK